MKTASHQNGTARFLLVEVPASACDFGVSNYAEELSWAYGEPGAVTDTDSIHLPDCPWMLLGLASELSELQAHDVAEGAVGSRFFYKNYKYPSHVTPTARESVLSLCRSLSLEPSTTLILKSR